MMSDVHIESLHPCPLTLEQLEAAARGEVRILYQQREIAYTLPSALYQAYQRAKERGFVVFTSREDPLLERVYSEFCELQKRPFVYVVFYTGDEFNEIPTDPDIARVGYDCITNHCWPTPTTLRHIEERCQRARIYEDPLTRITVSVGMVRAPEYTAEKLAGDIYALLTAPGACRYANHPKDLPPLPDGAAKR